MAETVNPQTELNQELKDKVFDCHAGKMTKQDFKDYAQYLIGDSDDWKKESIIEFCKNLMKAAEGYQRPFDSSKDY